MRYLTTLRNQHGELAAICRRHHVRELSVFGSATTPAFREDSDLDLLVDFASDAPIGLIELGKLQDELEVLFQRRVDLVPKRDLKLFVRDGILSQAEPLYAA